MNLILISYDLGAPENSTSYKKLIEAIQSYGTWAKPLESFRLIKTYKKAEAVRADLQGHLDSNDKLICLNINVTEYSTYGLTPDVIARFREHL